MPSIIIMIIKSSSIIFIIECILAADRITLESRTRKTTQIIEISFRFSRRGKQWKLMRITIRYKIITLSCYTIQWIDPQLTQTKNKIYWPALLISARHSADEKKTSSSQSLGDWKCAWHPVASHYQTPLTPDLNLIDWLGWPKTDWVETKNNKIYIRQNQICSMAQCSNGLSACWPVRFAHRSGFIFYSIRYFYIYVLCPFPFPLRLCASVFGHSHLCCDWWGNNANHLQTKLLYSNVSSGCCYCSLPACHRETHSQTHIQALVRSCKDTHTKSKSMMFMWCLHRCGLTKSSKLVCPFLLSIYNCATQKASRV